MTAGDPIWVRQPSAGQFTALDARCPHQGCEVDFVAATTGFICPCHQSRFTSSGARISGPTPRGLMPITVQVVNGRVRTG